MTWSLYDADLGTLELSQDNGILVEKFSPGSPAVREVLSDRPAQHGSIDETRFFGSRSVTMSGKFIATATKTITEVATSLKRYMMPTKRPVLRWTRDGVTRDIDVRVRRLEQDLMVVVDDFNIEWTATPFWRSNEIREVAIPYGGSGAVLSGDPFPWLGGPSEVIDFVVASEPEISANTILEGQGEAPAWPVITLFGPAIDPTVINLTTGESISFDALTLTAGQMLQVDMYNRTAVVDSQTNVFGKIDFTTSTWWAVQPGTQYAALATGTAPTSGVPWAAAQWYDQYL